MLGFLSQKYTLFVPLAFFGGKTIWKDKCSPAYSPSFFKHDEAGGNKRKLSIEHYNRVKKKTIGSDNFSVDRGFTIKDDFDAAIATLIIPAQAFSQGKKWTICQGSWNYTYNFQHDVRIQGKKVILDEPIPITLVINYH